MLDKLIIVLVLPSFLALLVSHHEYGAVWRLSNNNLAVLVVVLHEVLYMFDLDEADE
jgi:hypothetical protein